MNRVLPNNYSRLSSFDKLIAIYRALPEIGCNPKLIFQFQGFDGGEDDPLRTAAVSFNSTTILQVFGLVQILVENQPLTVRGAMYRGIGRLWPDSSEPSYRMCANLILKMRRLGIISYQWIVDGTRASRKPSSWSGLESFADTVAHAYRKDLWQRQDDYLEIFVEKDAMSGIIEPVTHEYDVRLNPIRGFGSETFIWEIAEEWKQIEKPIFVYYLGDHDPSGLKIEQDLRRRLTEYSETEVNWERLAITKEDFERDDLLGMPVKKNGPASKWKPYLDKFGDRCVEVDSIPATEIRDRVRKQIEFHIDDYEWQFLKDQEAREKKDVFSLIKGLNKEAHGG